MTDVVGDNSAGGARFRRAALVTTGGTTAAFGLLALLGWLLDLPRLASLGSHLIPMAPSTAVLFLASGLAVGLRAQPAPGRLALRLSAALSSAIALAALGLFTLASQNIRWKGEHLGLNIPDPAQGLSSGHISPVAAFCFLLASASCLISPAAPTARRGRRGLATVLAALLLGICFVFLLGYGFGAPLLYDGAFVPPALNTILALTTLGLSSLILTGWAESRRGDAPLVRFSLLGIAGLIAVSIAAAGYIYYRSFEQLSHHETEENLMAVASLKTAELERWRQERLGDGNLFFQNSDFSSRVRRVLRDPANESARHLLQAWIGKIGAYGQYDQVRLLDAQGGTRLSLPAALPPASAATLAAAAAALRSGQVSFQDFYRDEHNHRVYLAVVVPLFDEADANQPLGALVLRIDPQIFLYPFIQRWPVTSRTAETLLVRREGGQVVFLNALRFQADAALNLKIPLERTEVPFVGALLGQTGLLQGMGYNGALVLAAAFPVRDSPWRLVAKMDTAEVDEPLRERMWGTLLLIGVLLFGTGAFLNAAWRQQRVRFFRERYESAEALRVAETKYREIVEQMAEGVFRTTPGGRFEVANPALARILGFTSAAELMSARTDIGRQGYVRPERRAEFQRLIAERGQVTGFEYEACRQDGSIIWVSETARAIRNGAGEIKHYEGLVEDITARKAAEAALRASETEFRALFDDAPIGYHELDAEGRLTRVNHTELAMLGYAAEEMLGRPVWDFVVESDVSREAVRAKLAGTLPLAQDLEREFCKKDGTSLTVLTVDKLLRNQAGQITGIRTALQDITARKRAEAAVRASEARIRTWFELPLVGICITSPKKGWVEVNEQLCLMLGYDRQELFRMTWAELTHPDDMSADATQFDRVLRGEIDGYSLEKRFIRKNGEILHTDLAVHCVRLADQTVDYFVALIQDITARKQAEAAVRVSEGRIRTWFELPLIGNCITSPTKGWVEVNQHLCLMLGYDRQELFRMTWAELTHPDDLPADAAQFARVMSGEIEGYSLEKRFIRKNGGILHADLAVRCVRLADKTVNYLVALIQDITARKQAEAAVQRLSERLRIATRATGIGIWDWNIVHNDLIWDDTICEIYGVPHGGFTGGIMEWSEHLHPDDRSRVGNELQAAQRGEREYAPEFRIIWPDGSLHIIKANSQTFFDENGKPLRMVGTNVDITERKQIETALAASGRRLQYKNAELERYLYTASHDLKSPVVTVRTFLGYLEQDLAAADAGKIAQDLNFIRAAADKMAQLLDDLLEISRIGRVVAPPVRVTFRELVDEARAAVGGRIAQRGVVVTVDPGEVTLLGDRVRLAEVLQNLLDNACKFMGDQPAPRIAIGHEVSSGAAPSGRSGAGETVFFVRDNGIGLDPRHQAKVFGLFEKLDPQAEGTGIGLALVQRIVELHGGRIWVESAGAGQGACFYFTLPGAVNQTNPGEKS